MTLQPPVAQCIRKSMEIIHNKPVFLLSFIPSASCRSNSFTILSPSPLRGIETPQQVYQPQTDPEYPLKLSSQ